MKDLKTMPSSGGHDGMHLLLARLTSARRRFVLGRLLHAAAYGVATALAALCVLLLAARLGVDLAIGEMVLPALAVGAGVLLIGAAWTFVRLPPLHVFARGADRALGTQERLSTTLEWSSAPQKMTPISRVLMADTAQRAGAVEPDKVAPLRVPRATWAVVLLAVFSSVLVIVPPSDGGTIETEADVPPPQPQALSDEEIEFFSEMLREVASTIGFDAEVRENPELEEVARELEQLSEAVQSGEVADHDQLHERLQSLFDDAAESYRQAGETPGGERDFSVEIDLLLSRLEPVNNAGREPEVAASSPDPSADEESDGDEPAAAADEESGSEAEAPEGAEDSAQGDELAAEGEEPGPSTEEDGSDDGEPGDSEGPLEGQLQPSDDEEASDPLAEFVEFVDEAELADEETCIVGEPDCMPPTAEDGESAAALPDPDSMTIVPRQENTPAEDAIGGVAPPLDAPDGQAGQGTGSAPGELDQTWDQLNFREAIELLLEGSRIGDDHRIQMMAPPPAGEYTLPQGQQSGAENWARQPESGVRRMPLTQRERDALAGYFQ